MGGPARGTCWHPRHPQPRELPRGVGGVGPIDGVAAAQAQGVRWFSRQVRTWITRHSLRNLQLCERPAMQCDERVGLGRSRLHPKDDGRDGTVFPDVAGPCGGEKGTLRGEGVSWRRRQRRRRQWRQTTDRPPACGRGAAAPRVPFATAAAARWSRPSAGRTRPRWALCAAGRGTFNETLASLVRARGLGTDEGHEERRGEGGRRQPVGPLWRTHRRRPVDAAAPPLLTTCHPPVQVGCFFFFVQPEDADAPRQPHHTGAFCL